METKDFRDTEGITLISLIITIIVMLIIAGSTIAMLNGDSAIMKKTKKSKELTEIALEREAVQNAMLLANKRSILKGEEYNYIGRRLYDQNNYNSNTWDVIILNDSDQDPYGTGWSYVEKILK